jgi:hypothetical protein
MRMTDPAPRSPPGRTTPGPSTTSAQLPKHELLARSRSLAPSTAALPAARRRAEDLAEAVHVVSYVMNNIRVRQPGGSGASG